MRTGKSKRCDPRGSVTLRESITAPSRVIAIVPVTGVSLRFSIVTPSSNGAAFSSAGGSESAVIATLGIDRAPGGVKMSRRISALTIALIARSASPRFCHPSVTITAGPPCASGSAAIR